MDFKKGNWNLNDALDFDLEKASELLDDKSSNRIVGNLRKHMGPDGFPKPPSQAPRFPPDHDPHQYKPSKQSNISSKIPGIIYLFIFQRENS